MLLDLRQRLEYGLLLAIVLFVRAMPLGAATAVSARAWRFIAPKTRRHRRALKNLEKAMPEKTPAERQAIALAMWDNLGRVMAETILLDRVLRDPSRIEFENQAFVKRYKDKIGPIVIAAPHMGNWEVGMVLAQAVNARVAGVYRLVENPYVDRFIRRQRAPVYPGGLFASKSEEGFATVMRIASWVRSGGALGLLADLRRLEWRSGSFFRANDVGNHGPRLARPPRRSEFVGRAGDPHRQAVAIQNRLQGTQSSKDRQTRRGHQGNNGKHTKPIRGLDSRTSRAMDVVEQALEEPRNAGRDTRLMRMAVLQHVPFEGPAAIADWAASRGIEIAVAHLYRGDPLPALSEFRHTERYGRANERE